MKTYILSIIFPAVLLTASFGQSWSLKGNSGTNPPANFVGTTDSKALSFKTSNTERMRIVPGGKIGIGFTNPLQKLDVNGNINMGKGFSFHMENHPVLRVDSLRANTFLGNGAGSKNTYGIYNTASGYQALFFNTGGAYNTANGFHALFNNTSSYNNTATGAHALFSNTTGSANVANGSDALYYNSTGYANTATGDGALYFNVTGANNVASGQGALTLNTIGSYNTACGQRTMYRNTTGYYNTAVGFEALFNTTTSYGNTALGSNAGDSYDNGYYNTFIGSDADATGHGIYNSTALGSGASISTSNQVRIGNYYTTSIGGYADWTKISDGRVKKNIKENVPGLAFINKLTPVTYNLNLDAADKIIQRAVAKDKEARPDEPAGRGTPLIHQPSQMDINVRNAKQQVIHTGFIAQDVEKAAKELNYDFSGVDAAKNDKDLYALRYAEFVVPLVKAVQELSHQNEKLKNQNNDLQQRIEKLEAIINVQPATNHKLQTANSTNASLEQNMPNPFNRATTINYTLPQQFSFAKVIITDKSGKTLKQINVPGNGKGSLNFDASTLSPGAYQYSLYVDAKLISTKQMEHIK